MSTVANERELRAARIELHDVVRADGPELQAILERSHTAGLRGTFVVGAGLLTTAGATFLLWDSEERPDSGFPFRARMSQGGEFRHAGDSSPDWWSIDALESMCPSCFGTGMLDGEQRPCDTCGAIGWGLREVFATDVPELGGAGRRHAMASAAVGS